MAEQQIAGRYRLLRKVGEGGMGTVYEAVDELRNGPVALKRLSPKVAAEQPQTVALFQREFHTLKQLSHPCIVKAYEYGLEADGPFYTMELLDGRDLRAAAPEPWPKACALLRDVASALALLHSRGLLHRDVNPKNVRSTSDGRARLLDFGTLSTFGSHGEVAGMAPFVSPEALRGLPLDARSDLFSLGCLAYWVLTGQYGFDVQTNAELEACWERPPSPPSAFRSDIPAELDELVASAMHVDPLVRPPSAAAFIERLVELAGLPGGDATAARGYLSTPRLVGRSRQQERIRRVVQDALRRAQAVERSAAAPSVFTP